MAVLSIVNDQTRNECTSRTPMVRISLFNFILLVTQVSRKISLIQQSQAEGSLSTDSVFFGNFQLN